MGRRSWLTQQCECVCVCMCMCMCVCVFLSVCLSSPGPGAARAETGAVVSTRGGSSQLLFVPSPLTNSGPFQGHEWLTKNQKSTPVLESNWGLGVLNQGNILPSLLQTPLGLRAPWAPFPYW